MKVNEILRSLRRHKNLSIQNVAEELGIAYSTYQAYESVDDGKIQINTLEQIAKLHKMTVVELLAYEENEGAGNYVLEPAVPYSKRKGQGLKVIIELDGTDDILDAWYGKLKKINAALV
jgi:transcriptional regulator with XRE-family HTH domain